MSEQQESGSAFWKGAGGAAAVVVVVFAGISGALANTGFGNIVEFVVGGLLGVFAFGFFAVIAKLLIALLRSVPSYALVAFAGALAALALIRTSGTTALARGLLETWTWKWPAAFSNGLTVPALSVLLVTAAFVSGFIALKRRGQLQHLSSRVRLSLVAFTVALLALSTAIIVSLAREGSDPYPSEFRTLSGRLPEPLTAEDPSEPGSFTVGYFTYGAGPNERRPEFGEERDWESRTVNATPLLKEWKGLKKRMREWYWGFGLDAAPLNGLVWAPEGDGPFPLVLIVHGNHSMVEYSDPGYAYLGELLASRGFIAVSVDENYINGSWSGDFRGKEMPLRAWFLLEHLKLWRDWNGSATHPYSGKVDLSHIALVGHSRGGEAVPMAFAYNGLSHYPDDATIKFDYGFDIKSLVAIAQVDQRYHRRVELDNVSFLTLHGSYDSDEPAYHGMRQFNRISLNDDNYWFKAGIYIHRANHGQFNSIWGREDMGPPGAWLLNLKPIIPPEDQRQIAKVYIAAFLEATLKNDRRYVPLFRDPRRGADWLPDHAFVHQFTDSTFIPIADFDEDLDVTTGSTIGATISAESLTLWREEDLKHRDERQQGTHAVVLGWSGGNPVYSIHLPESFWEQVETDAGLLAFSISGSTEKPSQDKNENQDKKRDLSPFSPAFTLEVEDSAGRIARVRSADYANLAPPLRVQYLKPDSLNKARYKSEWEPVLQAFEVPLSVFAPEGGEWQASDIRFLRFRFDQASEGVVIIDDIGIRSLVAE